MKFGQVIEKNNAKMDIGQFLKNDNFCPLFGAKLAKFRDFVQFGPKKRKNMNV